MHRNEGGNDLPDLISWCNVTADQRTKYCSLVSYPEYLVCRQKFVLDLIFLHQLTHSREN